MSMKHKTGLSLLLLLGVAFVIHAFSTGGTPPEYREREITPAEFNTAQQFAAKMADCARKNDPWKFAERCLDAKDRKAADAWREMRKFSKTPGKLTGIVSFDKEPERCRLQLKNESGRLGTLVCRREKSGALKLIAFHAVDPAETE